MPFFYDLKRAFTTNASPNTETTELVGKTVANQQLLAIYAIYGACRFGTAGGAQLKLRSCTATAATGGTAQTPTAKLFGLAPASQSTWVDGATAITPGSTTVVRTTVGMAQTGGMGGWQALTPQDAFQSQANGANPLDQELTTNAFTASVTGDLTVEIGEGV